MVCFFAVDDSVATCGGAGVFDGGFESFGAGVAEVGGVEVGRCE